MSLANGFGALLVFGGDIDVAFTRGYVQHRVVRAHGFGGKRNLPFEFQNELLLLMFGRIDYG